MTAGRIDSVLTSYHAAAAGFLPDSITNGELGYWVVVTLTDQGLVEDSLPSSRGSAPTP